MIASEIERLMPEGTVTIARLRMLLAEAATLLDSAADRLSDVGHYNTASAMRTDASRLRREGGV